ncbi:MAG: PDR/VanB family oxidoreductase [Candidatus Pacebacteria bacterium]|nr:PDR/VanB family oxidoreductase [Candidatus Paceibacterota bacterium]
MFKSTGQIKVVVAARRDEADGIISLELRHPDGKNLPAFVAGSHIDLHLGKDLIRQYSLTNDPAETNRYLIGVLREPQSRGGSIAVHDKLKVGVALEISQPRNSFPLDESAKHTVLMAGGIGVTPMLAMALRLKSLGKSFELHYCVRSKSRAAFVPLIEEAGLKDHVHFHFDDGEPSQKLDPSKSLKPASGTHLYVCGPGGFMEFILKSARTNKWSEDQLHVEYFGAKPVDASAAAAAGSFRVKAKKSNKEFEVPPNKSIAKCLMENGIAIPTSCENGICGTCLTGVLEGIPDHQDSFQTKAEKEKNNMMTVCCSRSKSPLLVLDI